MRCAIYARYSSDKQNPKSSADQIRTCRSFAQPRGLEILESHIYSDDAISGSRSDRPSYQKLLDIIKEAEQSKHCPFDAILVEDSSRLWRDQAEQASAMKVLNSVGVRVLGCDGLDTGSNSGNLVLAFKGIMAEQYLSELGSRTRRGLQSAALEGSHTGGRCFGYKSEPMPVDGHSKRRPSRLVIDPGQAAIVRQIFTLYAEGNSLKAIAKRLNKDGIPSPQPYHGQQSRSWCPTSIRVIIRNERYRGIVVFGKTRKHRKSNDRRVAKPGPEADQVRREFPEQRIVSEDLWKQVRSRISEVKKVYGQRGRFGGLAANGRAAGSAYLFSGLLRCGTCGANLTLISGRGKNHKDSMYGCPMNFSRGACSNDVRIAKSALETHLLSKLQTEVLREDVIDFALSTFETQVKKAVQKVDTQAGQLEKRRAQLQKEIQNLAKAIASGLDSPSVRAEITSREAQIRDIETQVLSAKPESVRTNLRDLRQFVERSAKDLRKLLNSDTATAKATLMRHMPKIVLKPGTRDGRKVYQVVSEWELLPGKELAHLGGAEGGSSTKCAIPIRLELAA